MTVEEITELARAKKQAYAQWLADITPAQGAVLLSVIRDAFQFENGRAEHLDTKGNWILAASLAGLAVVTAASKALVSGLTGSGHTVILLAVLLIVLILFAACLFVLWGIRIKAAWFCPRPEIILREQIATFDEGYLYRDLILHYAEATIANSWISEGKARMLIRAQACLLSAFVLAVAIGLCRAVVNTPSTQTVQAASPTLSP